LRSAVGPALWRGCGIVGENGPEAGIYRRQAKSIMRGKRGTCCPELQADPAQAEDAAPGSLLRRVVKIYKRDQRLARKHDVDGMPAGEGLII